jgi:chromosome segregation ATPase
MTMPGQEGGEPPAHFYTMMQEILRSQRAVLNTIGQMAEQLREVREDSRLAQRIGPSVRDELVSLRGEVATLRSDVASLRSDLGSLRSEMTGRFEAVGSRFDTQDTLLERIERDMHSARSDIASLEIGILNAVQSALEAHQRLDARE